MSNPISTRIVRMAAADAELDVRTVSRMLAGEPVRPLCRERAVRALARQGIDLTQTPTSVSPRTKKGTK